MNGVTRFLSGDAPGSVPRYSCTSLPAAAPKSVSVSPGSGRNLGHVLLAMNAVDNSFGCARFVEKRDVCASSRSGCEKSQ
jgi:hypothetical protein